MKPVLDLYLRNNSIENIVSVDINKRCLELPHSSILLKSIFRKTVISYAYLGIDGLYLVRQYRVGGCSKFVYRYSI